MSNDPIIIAGGGPCGLGAALTLQNEYPHERFELAEANSFFGGSASSHTTPEGFTFDYGGHVLFPHKHYADFALLLERWVARWSRSCPIRGVYMRGRLIAAPVQRNIHALPVPLFAVIISDLIVNRLAQHFSHRKVSPNSEMSLETYLRGTFGQQMTRHVLGPLNQKMWALSPRELSSVWVRQRSGSNLSNITQISVRRLLKHAFAGIPDPGWDANTTVDYPASGGSGAIWAAAARTLHSDHLFLQKTIAAVITRERRVVFHDGSSRHYSHLISTMPLDTLLEICIDRPDLSVFAKGLRRSGVFLFGFGVAGHIPLAYRGVHSFHCPESSVPFWRVTIPSNFASGNTPEGRPSYSILCEVSFDVSGAPRIDETLRRGVQDGLIKIGLLRASESVLSAFEKALDHGYPLPFLGREELLNTIHRQLYPLNITSRGRFGGWRYEVSNQDHAFAQGVEAVHWIVKGTPELTYRHLGGPV